MKIDTERITSLIGEIEKATNILDEFAKEDKENILNNQKSLGSIKYFLIIATEACIDICNHIIAKEHIGVPESYSDCFNILCKKGIITKELAAKLIKMAKFRNLLVHLYWKIDDEQIYEILKFELSDFDEFIKQVAKKYL
jgi:uncharacterized protein YutE (UPF0331/DUF86 family)